MKKGEASFLLQAGLIAIFLGLALAQGAQPASADCSLTTIGVTPLMDMGGSTYQGFRGGLYPGGGNARPAVHEAVGLIIANQLIQPRDAAGNPDPQNGKIVMISVGMSNTSAEFAGKPDGFIWRAAHDPDVNPQLVIINGAQSGKDALAWVDPHSPAWDIVDDRLATKGLTPAQVQVAWVKQAVAGPGRGGQGFPQHAQLLQAHLEDIARNLKIRYPNIQIAYYSSRTRAYTDDPKTLNPEPFAYESGFSVKWMIEKQINGDPSLNFDPARGAVVAPYLAWGPYLWADGPNPRSDGFTWLCSDVKEDFIHPSASGVSKIGGLLHSFFKTDSTAMPWFLVGAPPPPTGTPLPTPTPSATPTPRPTPVPPQSFGDVPPDHPYYLYIEALYQGDYVKGCSEDPPLYCPDRAMNRAESAVFTVRGVHGADFMPPQPSQQVFADVAPDAWYADWVTQLWEDGYTAGCSAEPLLYCAERTHTRAEGAVFFLRMLYGPAYQPPPPKGYFADVPIHAWYADWVDAAWEAGIAEPCATEPELRYCPEEPLSRAAAAYMMALAKGLSAP